MCTPSRYLRDAGRDRGWARFEGLAGGGQPGVEGWAQRPGTTVAGARFPAARAAGVLPAHAARLRRREARPSCPLHPLWSLPCRWRAHREECPPKAPMSFTSLWSAVPLKESLAPSAGTGPTAQGSRCGRS